MTREIVSKGWTKLDSGIVDSTLWAKDHETLRAWIALLAKCDAGGYARVAIPPMATLCQLSVERFEEIIDDLCAPDPYSRCSEHEGRRLARVEGGFVVLSYERYRSMRTRALTDAERKQRQRERQRAQELVTKSHVCHESHDVTPEAEAEADTEAETTGTARSPKANGHPPGFDEFWKAYPRKQAKKDARKAWKTTARGRPPLEDLLAVLEYHGQSRQWRENVIPLPATWLRGERWADEMPGEEIGDDDIDRVFRRMKREQAL